MMPILGIGYLVTIVGPDPTISWAHNTFQIIRSVLLSTQVIRHSWLLGYFIVRIEAVYCLQGEKAVRELLQSKKILKRLLKSMRKPS